MVVFQILARTEQSRTLPFVKKCDLEREEKDTIIAHNDAPVHGLASFISLSLSLSYSLFFFARFTRLSDTKPMRGLDLSSLTSPIGLAAGNQASSSMVLWVVRFVWLTEELEVIAK